MCPFSDYQDISQSDYWGLILEKLRGGQGNENKDNFIDSRIQFEHVGALPKASLEV